MFIRFVVNEICKDSQKRTGVFDVIYRLIDENKLLIEEEQRMKVILEWFSKNLQKPDSFSRSSRNNPVDKAISWFKDSANEHILKIREIISVLETHGIHVEMIKTERPGYIVYEDEFQVAAEPFHETRA